LETVVKRLSVPSWLTFVGNEHWADGPDTEKFEFGGLMQTTLTAQGADTHLLGKIIFNRGDRAVIRMEPNMGATAYGHCIYHYLKNVWQIPDIELVHALDFHSRGEYQKDIIDWYSLSARLSMDLNDYVFKRHRCRHLSLVAEVLMTDAILNKFNMDQHIIPCRDFVAVYEAGDTLNRGSTQAFKIAWERMLWQYSTGASTYPSIHDFRLKHEEGNIWNHRSGVSKAYKKTIEEWMDEHEVIYQFNPEYEAENCVVGLSHKYKTLPASVLMSYIYSNGLFKTPHELAKVLDPCHKLATSVIKKYLPELFEGRYTPRQLGEMWAEARKVLSGDVKNRKNRKKTDDHCPDCGRPFYDSWTEFGKYLACVCGTTRPVVEASGKMCTCGMGEVVKQELHPGVRVLRCSTYPSCVRIWGPFDDSGIAILTS
jgi:hypothetical protein